MRWCFVCVLIMGLKLIDSQNLIPLHFPTLTPARQLSLTATFISTQNSSKYCPSGYSYFSESDGCYLFRNTQLNWYDAKIACEQRSNGWLVTISNGTVNVYIRSLIPIGIGSQPWI